MSAETPSDIVKRVTALEQSLGIAAADAFHLLLEVTKDEDKPALRPSREFWIDVKHEQHVEKGAHGHLSCSFCGRGQRLVKTLIAGPTVYICDGCIEKCVGVLADSGVPRG